MDNLKIVQDRIVENTKVNPRKYGLVKQLGPYDITPADLYNAHIPPTKPRREQFVQPDATPLGVADELSLMPVLLGGGFSMENGSVVQEAIYDARITAPGQKVRGIPMEGPGVLKAIQSIMGSSQTVAPSTPGQMAPTTQPMAEPTTTPTPTGPADPAWMTDLKNWDSLSERKRMDLIKRYGGGNEVAFKDIVPKMTQEEKDAFARIIKAYFMQRENVTICNEDGRNKPCTQEQREAWIAAEKLFQEVTMKLLGAVFEMLF
jgi:hypothetical protein